MGGLVLPYPMIIEISYEYKEDKNSTPRESWTYFHVQGDKLTAALKKKAETHFKKFIKENGWGRKAKLKSIQIARNK